MNECKSTGDQDGSSWPVVSCVALSSTLATLLSASLAGGLPWSDTEPSYWYSIITSGTLLASALWLLRYQLRKWQTAPTDKLATAIYQAPLDKEPSDTTLSKMIFEESRSDVSSQERYVEALRVRAGVALTVIGLLGSFRLAVDSRGLEEWAAHITAGLVTGAVLLVICIWSPRWTWQFAMPNTVEILRNTPFPVSATEGGKYRVLASCSRANYDRNERQIAKLQRLLTGMLVVFGLSILVLLMSVGDRMGR